MLYSLTRVVKNTPYLHEALGISPERAQQLSNRMDQIAKLEMLDTSSDAGQILIKISEEVTSLNELVFTGVIFGRHIAEIANQDD